MNMKSLVLVMIGLAGGLAAADEATTHGGADVLPPALADRPTNVVVRVPATATNAVVFYTPPRAIDNRDGALPVICQPASGSTIPLGTAMVVCTAIDAASNRIDYYFMVRVVAGPRSR